MRPIRRSFASRTPPCLRPSMPCVPPPGKNSPTPNSASRIARFWKAWKSTGRAWCGSWMTRVLRWTITLRDELAAAQPWGGKTPTPPVGSGAAMFSLSATLAHWKLDPRRWLTGYLEKRCGGRGQSTRGHPAFLSLEPVRRTSRGGGGPDLVSLAHPTRLNPACRSFGLRHAGPNLFHPWRSPALG